VKFVQQKRTGEKSMGIYPHVTPLSANEVLLRNYQATSTPRKINGWNLEITHLEKENHPSFSGSKDDDYPIIYRVGKPSQVVVWDFVHQQY